MKENIYIFDFDGVIGDSVDFHVRGFREHTGLDVGRKDFQEMQMTNIYESPWYQEHADKLAGYGAYLKNATHEIRLFDGMDQIVEQCQSAGVCYIVSSGNEEKMKDFLVENQMQDAFKARIMGSDTHFSKVVKLEMIKERHDGSNYFFVTDTVGDIREAQVAQVPTYAVTWGYHDREMLCAAQPDVLCDTVEELSAALSLEMN